jgi:protoporphyrinogen oxidase
LNTPVKKLVQMAGGWRVTITEGRVPQVPNPENKIGGSQSLSLRDIEVDFDAVIYCGTAHRLAEWQIETNAHLTAALSPSDEARGKHVDLSAFAQIKHPPVSAVVLGFRREDVAHPCAGFGMLIPKIEGCKILGTIFSSALFPNRAPAGHITLTSYVGGTRYPELGLLPPEQLIETTLADLHTLLGVKGKPVFTHTKTWPKAIPQYNVGYGKYRQLLNDLEAQMPDLFFAGSYRDGVSLGDSIVSGVNIAERVVKLF